MQCSLIVCTHNRSKHLENCLQKIARQDYPTNKLEVLVIDNNSSDNTRVLVEETCKNYPFELNYHLEIPLGLSYARNTGLRKAKGEILIYLDDDAFPENKDWIKKIVAAYKENPGVAAAGGEILPIWPKGKAPSWLAKLLQGPLSISPQGIERNSIANYKNLPWGANISFRKSTLKELGLSFDTNLGRVGNQVLSGEESLLCIELIKRNKKVMLLAEAKVFHQIAPERLAQEWFFKHAYGQGISEAYLEIKAFSDTAVIYSALRRLSIFLPSSIFAILAILLQNEKYKLLFCYLTKKHAVFLKQVLWHFQQKAIHGILLPKLRSMRNKICPPKLIRLDKNEIPSGQRELRAFIKVKNEGKRLDYFFKYYENLGVDRFFVIDNNSSDLTYDICAKKNNLHYFKTEEHFSRQLLWLDFLLNSYGKNHWCLFVDADEFILLNEQEGNSLKMLSRRLEQQGYSSMPFVLLDTYAKTAVIDNSLVEGENPLEKFCFFDSDLPAKREDGQWYGGMRKRVFGCSPDLTKYPLVLCDSRISFMRGLHRIYGAKISNSRGVILHTKYSKDLILTSQDESIRSAYYKKGIEYQAYAATFEKNINLSLFAANSLKFINSKQLLDLGLIQE